jgi:hypothetical protein
MNALGPSSDHRISIRSRRSTLFELQGTSRAFHLARNGSQLGRWEELG